MGERETGRTRDTGWQVGARRTLRVPPERAWRWVVGAGLPYWLGAGAPARLAEGQAFALADGTTGVVRVLRPGSHLRLGWEPAGWPRASTIQVRVLAAARGATIAFHQEHLPDAAARAERGRVLRAALQAAERALT